MQCAWSPHMRGASMHRAVLRYLRSQAESPTIPTTRYSLYYYILAMAMQVMLYGYTLSFLWIGDEAEQPWTRQPHVEMVVCSLDTWC